MLTKLFSFFLSRLLSPPLRPLVKSQPSSHSVNWLNSDIRPHTSHDNWFANGICQLSSPKSPRPHYDLTRSYSFNYRIPLTFRHHKPLRASGLRYIYRLPFDLIIVWNRSPYDWYHSSLPSPRLLAAQGDSSQAHSLRLVIRSRSLDGSLLPP